MERVKVGGDAKGGRGVARGRSNVGTIGRGGAGQAMKEGASGVGESKGM